MHRDLPPQVCHRLLSRATRSWTRDTTKTAPGDLRAISAAG